MAGDAPDHEGGRGFAQGVVEIVGPDLDRIVQQSDPFGHGWCLLEFRGRGYDEIAGMQ